MSFRVILVVLWATFSAARIVVASPGPPLVPGEELKYSVSWAIVPGAGEIVVKAEPMDGSQLKITTNTSTRRLARMLLPFDATADSVYDAASGRLVSLHDRSQTRGKHAEHFVTFDYTRREARYVAIGATTARMLPMPEGSPADLITALLETRLWSLKPGEKRDTLVIFDHEFYELTIYALRYEDVTTELGSFRTLVLQPRMEKTPPKGMFRKGSSVQVWISEEDRRLPVKFEVEFNIGTGTATLVSYRPPDARPNAGASPALATGSPAADAVAGE